KPGSEVIKNDDATLAQLAGWKDDSFHTSHAAKSLKNDDATLAQLAGWKDDSFHTSYAVKSLKTMTRH
ncbi:MAG: hypothetical protein LPH20_07400, partial [Shewanella sp.]|nr:hypothetical protein [Shewanella sp.]